MLCEAIRPIVRQFTDDHLDEKDYQEVQSHLASCEKCRQYTSSVGTLCYRLHEMGQTAIPPDMASTVLYQLKKMPLPIESVPVVETVLPTFPEPPLAGAFNAQTRPFWIAVLALGIVSIAAISSAFFWRAKSVTGPALPVSPKDAITAVVSAPERMIERHFHLSLSGRQELADLIIEMQLAMERDADRSLVFLVPAEKAAQFQDRITTLSGMVREFGDPPASEPVGNERVTVFFE